MQRAIIAKCNALFMNNIGIVFAFIIITTALGICDALEIISVSRTSHGDIYEVQGCRAQDGSMKKPVASDCTLGQEEGAANSTQKCKCQCHEATPIFRQDQLSCVSNLEECPTKHISPFILENIFDMKRSSDSQFIRLQNDHTASEMSVKSSCSVIKGIVMTTNGWKPLEKSIYEQIFRFYKSEMREIKSRVTKVLLVQKYNLEGKLMLFQVFCDGDASFLATSHCLSLRIQGIDDLQKKMKSDSFAAKETVKFEGKIFIWIGVVLGILTGFYLIVSLLYFKLRKRQMKTNQKSGDNMKELENGKSNEAFSHGDKHKNFKDAPDIKMFLNYEDEKKQNFDGDSESEDDIYSTPSIDEEMEGQRQRIEHLKKLADANAALFDNSEEFHEYDVPYETIFQSLQSKINEQSGELSEENSHNLAATGEMKSSTESKLIEKKHKRKLFFSPSYFERDLLEKPPPAALEFLSNVREMMMTAKQKFHTKTFQPTLIDIPEGYGSIAESIYGETTSIKGRLSKDATKLKLNNENHLTTSVEKHVSLSSNDLLNGDLQKKVANRSYYNILMSKLNAMDQESKDGTSGINENKSNDNSIYQEYMELNSNLTKLPIKDSSNFECRDIIIDRPSNNYSEQISNLKNKCVIAITRNKSFKENKEMLKTSVENMRQEFQAKLKRVSSISRIHSFKKSRNGSTENTSQEPDYLTMEGKRIEVSSAFHSNNHQENDENIKTNIYLSGENEKENNINSADIICSTFADTNSLSRKKDDSPECQQDKDNEVYTFDVNSHFIKRSSSTATTTQKDIDIYKVPKSTNIFRRFSFDKFDKNFKRKEKFLAPTQNNSLSNVGQQNCAVKSKFKEQESIYEDVEDGENYLKNNQDAKENEGSDENNEHIHNENGNSKIHIPGDYSVKSLRKNFLCIDIYDDLKVKNKVNNSQSNQLSKNESKISVKRSDSIAQDSLERPKMKKKLNLEKEVTSNSKLNNNSVQLKYLNETVSQMQSGEVSTPVRNAAIRRSKTLKTFKDYKRLKFGSNKLSLENKLTFFGEGINLTYCIGNSLSSIPSDESHYQVPQSGRPVEDGNGNNVVAIDNFHSLNSNTNIPQVHAVKHSYSFSPVDLSKRMKQQETHNSFHSDDPCRNIFTTENSMKCKADFNIRTESKSVLQNKNLISNDAKEQKESFIHHQVSSTQNNSKTPSKSPATSAFSVNPMNAHPSDTKHSISNLLPIHLSGSPSKLEETIPNGSSQQINGLTPSHKFQGLNKKDPKTIEMIEESVRRQMERFLREKNERINTKHSFRKVEKSHSEIDRNINEKVSTKQSPLTSSVEEELNSEVMSNADKLNSNVRKSNSVSSKPSFKKKTSNFINKSVSMNRKSTEKAFGLSNQNRQKFSVYVNDSFDND